MEFAREQIRNFVIIAHIDHGKSTLADRMLELTGTVEKRKMRDQFLDQMELEREKGITIKMQPVRMRYKDYVLNLIDTPGHVDFSYEVSRALACVEGVILLVDATQGVQAQTISNLHFAKKENLKIIPVINKIDLPNAQVEETKIEIQKLLNVPDEDILTISAKTGEGADGVLKEVIKKIPSPRTTLFKNGSPLRALIFDSMFDPYKGIIAYVRIFNGSVQQGETLNMLATGAQCEALEIGYFLPQLVPQQSFGDGEIGYIATGLKEPSKIQIGDTITRHIDISKYQIEPLPGYSEPKPMVWSSVFPKNQDGFDEMKDALKKLKLNDSALTFEIESVEALGRGFKVGFLGTLHLEIVGERLRREYGFDIIFTNPSVLYKLKLQHGGDMNAYSASGFPEESNILEIQEPWVRLEIIMPHRYQGALMELLDNKRGKFISSEYLGIERLILYYEVPLTEIVIDFYDQLKSVTSGYGSLFYELLDWRKSDLVKLDILIAGNKEDAFSQVVPRERAYDEGKRIIHKLKELLPPQLFAVSLQAAVGGRILVRENLKTLKKNVTAHLYGGDRTRKMKLWEKQKKGKEKLKASGRVEIPPEVFLKMLKK